MVAIVEVLNLVLEIISKWFEVVNQNISEFLVITHIVLIGWLLLNEIAKNLPRSKVTKLSY